MNVYCAHLNEFLNKNGTDSYQLIHSYFITCIAKGAPKRKARDCYCRICHKRKHIHACLECPYFGCYPEHIRIHHVTAKHCFAVELLYGGVYCFICSDYMYHTKLVSIGRKNKVLEAKVHGTHLFSPWQPTAEQLHLMGKMFFEDNKLKVHTFSGLRGIHNFGNTCYISCILQVFIHTPLLMDYFLGDKHVCKLNSNCMVCEMISIYQKFYSPQKCELVLEKLLYLVFKTANQFSSTDQQDAEEFFLKFIDVLCMHNGGVSEPGISHCECIFHKTFSSLVWEETLCSNCSTVLNTRSEEYLLCLSLDLGTEGCTSDGKKKTIKNCLEKYTSKQMRGVKKFCVECNEETDTCTQRTIKKLPVVVSLHLQRKSHFTEGYGTKKVTFIKNTEFVEFNDCLDLSSFVSCFCETNKKNPPPGYSVLNDYSKRYSLYAVVCHKGNVDSGHYICYVKLTDNEWYICDDSKIRKVQPSEVFSAEGYMLFYHKKILDYDVDSL
ncbi:ubiquitin carboxyl-terminal hydrolase 22-like isoform X1 [Uloborus diversus]|uniref:ubiquitin carboxyl-terminal hydrolase 22-like isoform X1 n=2 Tax=Uloborus diversus TaxID=327109 RepID=UPI002409AEBD|nr:ubiquitin carboxyl-terminal hydrolase 22-like isoform X1 [Uloborus diversus]